ncbi:MAG TPA: ABC transporter permease [Acholeplasmataceae bacterium]|nr:ABC transporter permease [Acholeplasmataceae bacterium]
MKNVFKIVKKEMDKIFKFPRTIFSTLIFPGLMLFLIYAVIGVIASKEVDKVEQHTSVVHIINAPESFDFALDAAKESNIEYTESQPDQETELKAAVELGTIDAVVVFDADFDQKIREQTGVPGVKIYYNPTLMNSEMANNKLIILIEMQKANLLTELNINPDIFETSTEGIYDEKKASGSSLGILLPILLVSFIFAGAMTVGADAVAGEKERGTLATLLMAPLKRDEIILGKIISTTLTNFCYAASSFVGIIAALPFMKSLFGAEGTTITYSVGDYLSLFGIIILMAVFASTILLVTSTIAKTVKEATMYAMPVYMIAMLLPMLTMFSQTKTESTTAYIIPIYNCIIAIKGVLTDEIDLLSYLLTVGSMVLYTALLVLLLIRLFKQERVLFSK